MHHATTHGHRFIEDLLFQLDSFKGLDAPCGQGEVDAPATFVSCSAWVTTLFENSDIVSIIGKQAGQQRAGESPTYDRDSPLVAHEVESPKDSAMRVAKR